MPLSGKYIRSYLLMLCLIALGCSNPKSDQALQTVLEPEVKIEPVNDQSTDFDDGAVFENKPVQLLDLEGIKERGTLRVIVDNSSTSYFIYKGRRMGFEYELLSRLCEDLGLDLKIKVTEDLENAFELLEDGTADLLAYHLTVTLDRKKRVDFTSSHAQIKQVLIQRRPQNWRKMKLHEIERSMLRDVVDLGGKEIHVRKGSAFALRLENLSEEIGEEINIVEVEEVSSEFLIEQVLNGEIEFTVADEDLAKINKSYHPDLDVETAISFPQRIAWAVRKESPELKNAIDQEIFELKQTADFQTIYDRYYKYTKSQRRRTQSEYSSSTGGDISPYDDLIKNGARELSWDWRLLAAQVYQESRFDPKTVSWAGAEGLMQLTKNTQKAYGLKRPFNPAENVKAGVSHIKWLEEYWDEVIPDEEERLKFILASYNTGHAHVADARRLAEKYGADPNVWFGEVEKYLLLKSNPKYFKDPVVRYGYCKGVEPTNYVRDILERHQEYKNFFEDDLKEETTATL